MGTGLLPGGSVPYCPVCDGPCQEEFVRSEYRFPDRLPEANPKPKAVKPRKRRGRRLQEDTAIHGPTEDRMTRPSEDR